ncbi:hypothetical protein NPIL_281371 [Nephila pilipes]|uniref:Uncharacterized protein n=1 Tax=Nephila pilipes TaxID=299642 RepID=A0A8X6QUS4_NEPPI|nr:hypothetical protein NPIL_281371 [Nephila pilipes]
MKLFKTCLHFGYENPKFVPKVRWITSRNQQEVPPEVMGKIMEGVGKPVLPMLVACRLFYSARSCQLNPCFSDSSEFQDALVSRTSVMR